jgi:hypothetical protein
MCVSIDLSLEAIIFIPLILFYLLFFQINSTFERLIERKNLFIQTLKGSETYLQLNSYENKLKIIDENYLLLKVFT